MKKLLLIPALVISGIALVLAADLGSRAFTFVDVGGHQLRLLITGQGAPTVVFESGGVGNSSDVLEFWERVQPAVSRFARTVSYDRAGVGWSEPGSGSHDARTVAQELHTALQKAGVAPPYILAGHSFGGPLIRVFAGLYPGEVAGLVLIDPSQEDFFAWNDQHDSEHQVRQEEESQVIEATFAQARQSVVPPGIPVALITAMGPRVLPSFISEEEKESRKVQKSMWLKFHSDWVTTVPGAKHIITENSGHGVPMEEPDLVIGAIRRAVEQARKRPGS